MNPREFYDTVVQMRKMQKEYFKTRNSLALRRSMQLEKLVDDEIERVSRIHGDSETDGSKLQIVIND